MKKKRIIRIRNPKLQKIRNQLRLILDLAVSDELNKLRYRSIATGITPANLVEFEKIYMKSIIRCPLCYFGLKRNMVYNLISDEWVCEDCVSRIKVGFVNRLKKKENGEWVPSDYDEEYVQGFFENNLNY